MNCSSKKMALLCYVLWLLTASSVNAFDPGPGPGNIDGSNTAAYVSQTFTFTDGCYARGTVYFQNGFIIAPNSTVTFGVIPPIPPINLGFDVTSTILLTAPLRIGPGSSAATLSGTFIGSGPYSNGAVIISECDLATRNASLYAFAPTYFPGNATLDLSGHTLTMAFNWVGLQPTIYFGASTSATLTLKNAQILVEQPGEPFRNILGTAAPQLIFDNSVLEISQLTINNITLAFANNCAIRNIRCIAPPPATSGSRPKSVSRASCLIDSTVPSFNSSIKLNGKVVLTIGPDVDMTIGNLGRRSVIYYPFFPPITLNAYGSFIASPPNLDTQVVLFDSSITYSLPGAFEGGTRLTIQGTCDLYSIAAPHDRVLIISGINNNIDLINADLDIQPASTLNLHGISLLNYNNSVS